MLYGDALGMNIAMDLGWIRTFAAGSAAPQISVATESRSGTTVPDLSIEVDNLSDVRRRQAAGFEIECGPVPEPWGVTRFYVRESTGCW
jgi:hypothetical protein